MKLVLMVIIFLLISTFVVYAGEVEDGQAIFKARCNNCHQYPDPGMLKSEQWRRLLDAKQKLMEKAGMIPLTPVEYKALLDYLDKNAKK